MGKFMIRFVSIVIVLWGLIVQPLMVAAMPAKMMMDSTHSSMVVDMVADADTLVYVDEHHDNHAESPGSASKAPCHEKSPDASSSEHSDKCDDNGPCATSCVVGSGVAAFQKMSVNLGLNNNTLVITTTETRSYGFPSRIFHPPKHS